MLGASSYCFGNHRRQSHQSRLDLGCVSAVDSEGRTIWIADAHRDGKRFIVRADEILTAFLELDSAIRPKRDRSSFSNKPAATHPALWLMDVESLAKMSKRNYKSSFSQADNCLEKRLCIAPPLVLA
jgi:hypothetical protein